MCLYPKLILNKKYVANKKNGGVIPPILDHRVKYVPVGCGKCMECRKQKARNWQIRLSEEIKNDNSAQFVNFTFSNKAFVELGKDISNSEGYEADHAICRLAIRRFLEKWRKSEKISVKHWFVNEIGGKYSQRVHIHGIMFTNKIELIKDKWQYGHVYIGDYVNEKTITYIVKYVHKVDEKHKYFTPKIFTSPGIGKGYFNDVNKKRNRFNGEKTKDNYKGSNGSIMSLPKYFRNKLFSDDEREKLWLMMLDQEVRYVNKVKIKVNTPFGRNDYQKAVLEARRINERLGFGNDEKDWDKIRYENSLRQLGQIKREKKNKKENKENETKLRNWMIWRESKND